MFSKGQYCFANISTTKAWSVHIWSNFMRMHIDKKLCHFFMVNQSSLLTLIFIEIAWGFFLLSKFKLLVDIWIKNRPKGVPKSQNNFFTFGYNSGWKNPNILTSKLYKVTKSVISPQRKLRSLWNFKLTTHQIFIRAKMRAHGSLWKFSWRSGTLLWA